MPEPFPDPKHVRSWIRQNHESIPVDQTVTFKTTDQSESDTVECKVINSTKLYRGCYPSYYDDFACEVVLEVDGYGKVKAKAVIDKESDPIRR